MLNTYTYKAPVSHRPISFQSSDCELGGVKRPRALAMNQTPNTKLTHTAGKRWLYGHQRSFEVSDSSGFELSPIPSKEWLQLHH